MSQFGEMHVRPEVARTLESWGWTPAHRLVREVVPTAARGHNVVLVGTPVPAAAAPLVGAALGQVTPAAPGLLICPAAQLVEWGGLAHALAEGTGLRVETAAAATRPMRRLRSASLDLLVAAPETAGALLAQSALKAERLGLVLLAQPELYADEPALAALMQDVPRTAQRIVITADAAGAADVVERYARKALIAGAAPADEPPAPPLGPVRTVGVTWSRRVTALADLLHLLDPARTVIWAADLSHAASIARAVPLDGDSVQLVTADAPAADVIIAFDLPSREQLPQLLGAGEVVLLVPPGTEGYVDRLAAPQRPLRLPGVVEELARAAARDRAAVQAELETGQWHDGVHTLAPLFERHDAVRVAAALYALWKRGATAVPASAAAGTPTTATTARIWVSLGKKDGLTANDLVGALTREHRVPPASIGRIDLRETFSLVEVPAAEAERVAHALNGSTIRRAKVVARLDRGDARPAGRPAARSPRGSR